MPTAPVLAVLICNDGEQWLPDTLNALYESSLRPLLTIAVNTGSIEAAELLASDLEDPDGLIADIVTVDSDNTADAITAAVAAAPSDIDASWIWVLHDYSAPVPDCLAALLSAADASPSAGVLGPVAVDWEDRQLVVEAGLSSDSAGRRVNDMGLERGTLTEQSSEVLAMPSAGSLIRRSLYDDLGGFDAAVGSVSDVDFGWRVNNFGSTVLCVPRGRVRVGSLLEGQDRVSGVRTYLANCSTGAFALGVPRLLLTCLLRAIGLLLIGRFGRAKAEFAAAGAVGGAGTLRPRRSAERKRARGRGGTRGLFASGPSRHSGALGTLPESSTPATWAPEEELRAASVDRRRAAESAALARARAKERADPEGDDTTESDVDGVAAAGAVATATEADESEADTSSVDIQPGHRPEPVEIAPARKPRPSPGAVEDTGDFFADTRRSRGRLARIFTPAVVLVLALAALALIVNWHRLGLQLTGGRLLPAAGLLETWDSYLANWHPTGGGTSANAPAALAVLGVLGAPLWPIGGPSAAIALLLLLDIPLAALTAYFATRKLRVRPWTRALLAAAYALVPAAAAAVAQGRLDVIVVHIMLPLVIAGIGRVLRPEGIGRRRGMGERWLSHAVLASAGLAVIGAFSPLTHLLLLGVALVGFIVMPTRVRVARRIAGLATLVLLPLALLLPWPVTVVLHPELLLHGVGARVENAPVSKLEAVLLDPGGAGAFPVGILLALAALAAVIARPRLSALIGVLVAVVGVVGIGVLWRFPAEPAIGGHERMGWTGAPMIVISAGLLMVLLAAAYQRKKSEEPTALHRIALGAGVGGVLVLVLAVVVGSGESLLRSFSPVDAQASPVRPAEEQTLAAPLVSELEKGGRSVLVLNSESEPPQVSYEDMPTYGEDDLPLPPSTPERLGGWQQALLQGAAEPNIVRDTVAEASASGVLLVVLPPGTDAEPILQAGGEVVTRAAPLPDGRQVVRLKPRGGQVTLISPELSKRAIGGEPPTGDIEGEGLAIVGDSLPNVGVRVSDGPGGRLLVLAATHEDGWRATVNGERKPIVPAWGHQVAVEVPTRASDVVLDRPDPVRTMLLLGQVGAVLFSVLTAIPAGRLRRE